MQEYLTRARSALDGFEAAIAALAAEASQARGRALPGRCAGCLNEAITRIERLRVSLALPERTAVDLADLQWRLENDASALARQLKSLGDAFEEATGADAPLAAAWRPLALAVERQAQRVAASIFPNAIDGLREINRALWEVRLIERDYRETFRRAVRGEIKGLTPAQLEAVDLVATDVLDRFAAVNSLLNQLLASPLVGEPGTAAQLVQDARDALKAAVTRARSKAGSAYKPFRPCLARAERLARAVSRQFDDLRVPVFPSPERLEAFSRYIDHGLYRELAGVERFALMNIGSRIQSVRLAPPDADSLAAPRFEIRVFRVFADRVYFTANASFLEAMRQLVVTGAFERAPAGLHEFNDGSFKQRQGRQGTLQVSYATGSDTDPGDATRVRVDADIDLYRGKVPHLFGEVLVNHLTGSKTDQFKVWDTLVLNKVAPLGGFTVVAV